MNFGPVRTYWAMRFEALNQLFKNFAKSGSFRNTCGRVADFWAMYTARAYDSQSYSSWGATHIVRGSQPKTFNRGDSSAGEAVAFLFSIMTTATIVLEWVTTLYHTGSLYTPGESWLTATFDGETILAFIPKNGIMKIKGRFFVLLHIYPYHFDADLSVPGTHIPQGYKLKRQFVALDSLRLQHLVPLWPAYRKETRGKVEMRFVPL